MWITLLSVTLVCFSATVAGEYCTDVFTNCQSVKGSWIRCFEERIATCAPKGRSMPSFIWTVRSSEEAEVSASAEHRVHIPSSALQRSRGAGTEEGVQLVATVMESTYFKPRPNQGRRITPVRKQLVLGGLVLMVKAGTHSVTNLPQPIILTFNHNEQVENGTCVFWQSTLDDATGYWSTDGCETNDTGTEFVCSCNHMSFFAVLVNPVVTVDEHNATYLSYITYIGSALSIIFTVVSLIIYISLQRRRPEKVIGVHLQLTGALLCLHLSFLLCCFGVWQLNENEESWVCQGLGLFLHWSLLATISWTALEGFHLYLLLVQVFNIYVRRYLLKLSLVGWGLPTLIAVVCGISGCYGKYNLELRDANNHTSTAPMCWMSSHFRQRLLVSYVTTVAFPCLVILCNFCMLGVVVFKLWGLKAGHGGIERNSSWKKMNKRNWMKLWKDCATVLGLSCVLGLPWGLATTTYVSLTGIYVFTILNSLQGVFMFLWCLALTCKSRSDDDCSAREASSQKVMTTSF